MLQVDQNLIACHVFEVEEVVHWRLLLRESGSSILYFQVYIHEVGLLGAPRCVELEQSSSCSVIGRLLLLCVKLHQTLLNIQPLGTHS